MRLLIAGGGTGGHLYPGVAVAQEPPAHPRRHQVLFSGSTRGLEARVLPRLGLEFRPVRGSGLLGKSPGGVLRSLGLLALGFADAARILRSFRPDACLGVGGYVSFPVVALAALRGVPSAVQEQNAVPGLANRILGRWVRRVYAGMPAAARHLPGRKTRVTGNPVRDAFHRVPPYRPPEPGEKPRVLVVGGSQGARSLNETVPAALERMGRPVEVLHQAGEGGEEAVRARYGGREGVEVRAYLEDMAAACAWAHLVVARAGALTVSELAAAGRPAVLVPYPHAAGGHQEHNARAAEAQGAALCLTEGELTAGRLAGLLEDLLGDPERLARMARSARNSARPEAARAIVDDLLELAGARGQKTGGRG